MKNDKASKVKKILILQFQFDAKLSIKGVLLPLVHCYELFCLFNILTILLLMISDKFQLYILESVVL